MTTGAVGDLPVPALVLEGTDWDALEHSMGPAGDTPQMLADLLDADQRVRTQALDHLHHVVHHQNTLYDATVPAALYVAAILTDPRTSLPVDKEPHDAPGPLRAALLGWLGSVADAASDEAAASSRRCGFPPEDYPPFVQTCLLRPLLYRAVAAFFDAPDPHVREAAIDACIPLLDDRRLTRHRHRLIPLLRDPLAVSEVWQYRERAIERLEAWGEDVTGLQLKRDAFAVCDSQDITPASTTATPDLLWNSADDLPF
ncbi:hypothetical protein [Streptomyces sp. TLI_146]|uniref:hypothetical protein n=1 Tax=Streptomyces sp. TLI_146 TaxID=1938858 RepID=UPI000C702E05|nr:hypothetical protein [Streptomyces sp. TLI_146]PKV82661.1 hypothetical protein BX283_0103 [Streptomyces sp. TLI_146]